MQYQIAFYQTRDYSIMVTPMTPHGFTALNRSNGERRACRRYAMRLEVRYKVTRGRHVVDTGEGHTLDMSSEGILFSTNQLVMRGAAAELWIDWPVPLNGHPLRLVVHGRVVRSEGQNAAMRIARHEFRLAGNRELVPLGRAAVAAIGLASGQDLPPED
jgi:hypothetical protein